MKNLELNNYGVQEMNTVEMKEMNGGNPLIAVAAIVIGYACWAASFCYELGKD